MAQKHAQQSVNTEKAHPATPNLFNKIRRIPSVKDSSDQSKGKEAMVGIKSDVKTLKQLSSSGAAAKKKREDNQVDRGMRAIEGAVQARLQQDRDNNQSSS
ncbi:hypothetical protein Aspvir_004040 [Aspergillus viridinutans]|uniref:Uncharacterized protein n=1 Tax=Aspergillus viridinutans TaxID=75553 RepID=A0A9P3F021_ASPVI|nr:uncharacterized protein Aspvir_004040 [Aspergillus viridinutans]GIK00027.1 hypothetical protein Aspvir_004040 [Aspergillus viridinutans]